MRTALALSTMLWGTGDKIHAFVSSAQGMDKLMGETAEKLRLQPVVSEPSREMSTCPMYVICVNALNPEAQETTLRITN